MFKKVLTVLPLAVLAACATIDDVRARPPAWTGTFVGNYDALTNCIAANSTSTGHSVLPQFDARERKANVIIYNPQAQSAASEFSLRQVSEGQVEIVFRQRNTVFNQETNARSNRDVADRCARGA